MSALRHLARRVLAPGAFPAVLLVALGAAAEAQVSTPDPVPGWSFIPSLSSSGVYDDNVALATTVLVADSDYISVITPGGHLAFVGRHTRFDLGYRGSFSLYRTLSDLNSYEQRLNAGFSRQLTRHLTLKAQNRTAIVPSTDLLEVGELIFQRTGSRLNESTASLEAELSKRTTVGATYGFQWMEFDRDTPVRAFLRGGLEHRVGGEIRVKLSPRLNAGAEYALRHVLLDQAEIDPAPLSGPVPIGVIVDRALEASLADPAQGNFDIHGAGGFLEYDAAPRLTLVAGAGVARLQLRDGGSQTGPRVRAAVTKEWRRASLSARYGRAIVPSFGFGGTLETEEVGVNFERAFARDRAFWRLGGAWRDSRPGLGLEERLQLETVWVNTSIGIALTRWLQLEGFAGRVQQDSRVPGGVIIRNRVGFQVTTSQRLRIRQ